MTKDKNPRGLSREQKSLAALEAMPTWWPLPSDLHGSAGGDALAVDWLDDAGQPIPVPASWQRRSEDLYRLPGCARKSACAGLAGKRNWPAWGCAGCEHVPADMPADDLPLEPNAPHLATVAKMAEGIESFADAVEFWKQALRTAMAEAHDAGASLRMVANAARVSMATTRRAMQRLGVKPHGNENVRTVTAEAMAALRRVREIATAGEDD